jgi:glyoxylase-like metal-dependent hydrolase (beta-lactamase superfamily II)
MTPTRDPMQRSSHRGLLAFGAALALLAAACGDDRSADSPTEQALAALGGRKALAEMTSLSLTATGTAALPNQASEPGALHPAVHFVTGLSYLPEGHRFRIEHRRSINYPFDVVRTFTQLIDGAAGWTVGDEGVPFLYPPGDIAPDKAAAYATFQMLLHPHLLFRQVVDGELAASDAGRAILDGKPYGKVTLGLPPLALTALVDEATGDLARLTVTVHDTLLCDVELEIAYADWTEVGGGLRYPLSVAINLPAGVIYQETRSELAVNEALDGARFTLPPEATRPVNPPVAELGTKRILFNELMSLIGVPASLLQTTVHENQLAPGVFFLDATHNSLAVEQADHVVLIEAPLDRERSAAIAAWAAQKFPGKPITAVIATHHHFDHAGGLRYFVAAGASIVMQASTRSFFDERVFGASCTVLPDELAAHPRAASIAAVPALGSLRLDDPTNPVEVYAISSSHAGDMVVAYLPRQRALFNSDLYIPLPDPLRQLGLTPYFTAKDFRELAAGIAHHGLAPQLIVGGHGGVAPIEAFNADLAALP